MKNTYFPTKDVQEFEMKGSGDYVLITQLLQEEWQKKLYEIREHRNTRFAIEQEIEDCKQEAQKERKEIKPEIDTIHHKLRGIPKTKDTLLERKRLEQEKDELSKHLKELECNYRYELPRKIARITEQIPHLEQEAKNLQNEVELVSTNPIAFCQTMRQRVDRVLIDQDIGEISEELVKKTQHYAQKIIKALKIASLPINEGRFNVEGRGFSGGWATSTRIPYWKDGGGTYNDM